MREKLQRIRRLIAQDNAVVHKQQLLASIDHLISNVNQPQSLEENIRKLLVIAQEHADNNDYLSRKNASIPMTSLANPPVIYIAINELINIIVELKESTLQQDNQDTIENLCWDIGGSDRGLFWQLPENQEYDSGSIELKKRQILNVYRFNLATGLKPIDLPDYFDDWLRLGCHEYAFTDIYKENRSPKDRVFIRKSMNKAAIRTLVDRVIIDRLLCNLPIQFAAPRSTSQRIAQVQESQTLQYDPNHRICHLISSRLGFLSHLKEWGYWNDNFAEVQRPLPMQLSSSGSARNPVIIIRDQQGRVWFAQTSAAMIAGTPHSIFVFPEYAERAEPFLDLHAFYANPNMGLSGGAIDVVVIQSATHFNQQQFIESLPSGVHLQALKTITIEAIALAVNYTVDTDTLEIKLRTTHGEQKYQHGHLFGDLRHQSNQIVFLPVRIASYYHNGSYSALIQDPGYKLRLGVYQETPLSELKTVVRDSKITNTYRFWVIQRTLCLRKSAEHFAVLLSLRHPVLGFNFDSNTGDTFLNAVLSLWFNRYKLFNYNPTYSLRELLQFLEQNGADLTRRDNAGRNALHILLGCKNERYTKEHGQIKMTSQYVEVIEYLQSKIALDATDSYGRTVVHYAALASTNDNDVLEILIMFGLSHLFRVKDVYGNTALDYILRNNIHYAKKLLNHIVKLNNIAVSKIARAERLCPLLAHHPRGYYDVDPVIELIIAVYTGTLEKIQAMMNVEMGKELRIKLIIHGLHIRPYAEHFALMTILMDPVHKLNLDTAKGESLFCLIIKSWDTPEYNPAADKTYSKVALLAFLSKQGVAFQEDLSGIKTLVNESSGMSTLVHSRQKLHQHVNESTSSPAPSMKSLVSNFNVTK